MTMNPRNSSSSPIVPTKPRKTKDTDPDDEYEYVEVEGGQGCSGCGWGMAGGMGCLLIVLVPLAFLVITGVNSVAGIFNGITNIFDPGPPVYTIIGGTTILESVVALSELTTVQYNFSNLIVAERDLPDFISGLYRDRLTLNAVGEIEAGIDLSQVREEDVILENGTLIIRLPMPQLLDCSINEEATTIVERNTGAFARPAPNLDQEARLFAIRIFREQALESEILSDANAQAQLALTTFFGNLPLEGIDSVVIDTTLPDPSAMILPSTCD